jgi:hypothetical protein
VCQLLWHCAFEALENVRARLKHTQQQNRRMLSKISELEQQIALAQQKAHDVLAIEHVARCKLSVQTALAVGLRRNMTNMAAEDQGAVALTDISAQSVLRSEVITGGCLNGFASSWHAANELGLGVPSSTGSASVVPPPDSLADDGVLVAPIPDTPPTFQIALHYFACDATNSRVWRGSKVCTTEIRSAYLVDSSGLTPDSQILDHCSHQSFVADLQVVQDSTAKGTAAILLKQMQSVGCPTWRTPPPKSGPLLAPVFRIFVQCSDRGPDQVKLRKIIHHELRESPRTLYFDWTCVQHANALVFKGTLLLVDKWLSARGDPRTKNIVAVVGQS